MKMSALICIGTFCRGKKKKSENILDLWPEIHFDVTCSKLL